MRIGDDAGSSISQGSNEEDTRRVEAMARRIEGRGLKRLQHEAMVSVSQHLVRRATHSIPSSPVATSTVTRPECPSGRNRPIIFLNRDKDPFCAIKAIAQRR